MTVGELGEMALIAQLRALLDRPLTALLLGNGDDAAVLRADGDVVLTVDSVVEGVDWLPQKMPLRAIGHRAAAVNLSDLAAMGAQPQALLLALELPVSTLVSDVLEALEGLAALADQHGCGVVGGDVGFSPGPARWTVTAVGQLHGAGLQRDRARAGDAIWLIGDVGLAALGLRLLAAELPLDQPWMQQCVYAHVWPEPLVNAGLALQATRERMAAIDISDGLWRDADRLGRASSVHLDLALTTPRKLLAATEMGYDVATAMAHGGDDYALLVAVPAQFDVAAVVGAGAQRIGRARAGQAGATLVLDGVEMGQGGYQHGRWSLRK